MMADIASQLMGRWRHINAVIRRAMRADDEALYIPASAIGGATGRAQGYLEQGDVTRAARMYREIRAALKQLEQAQLLEGDARQSAYDAITRDMRDCGGYGSMARIMLQQIDQHTRLYRDPDSGIAWVEDGHIGAAHSAHANISTTGSVQGMRARGYWGADDRAVRSRGWYYNIDTSVVSDSLDALARDNCLCDGNHSARLPEEG